MDIGASLQGVEMNKGTETTTGTGRFLASRKLGLPLARTQRATDLSWNHGPEPWTERYTEIKRAEYHESPPNGARRNAGYFFRRPHL